MRYTFPREHLPIGVRDFYVNPSGDVVFLYISARAKPDDHIRRAVSTDGGDTFTFHRDNVLADWGKPVLDRNVDPKFVVLPDGRIRLYVATLVDNGSSSEPFWAILSATNP